MPRRSGRSFRVARWLWTSQRLDARVARAALVPAAGLWRLWQGASGLAHGTVARPAIDPPLPVIGLGRVTAGRSGLGLVASWVAARLVELGHRPGVVLGASQALEEELVAARVPGALVTAGGELDATLARLAGSGAQVAVLSGTIGHFRVPLDATLGVLGAETAIAARLPFPAGPWMAPRRAVAGVDVLVLTRRRADAATARQFADTLHAELGVPVACARLGVLRLRGLVSGQGHPPDALAGRRVVVASRGPELPGVVAHAKATGAAVQVHQWRDGPEFRDADLAWLAHASRRADVVVVTERDALRLADRWPAAAREPLVAEQGLAWEAGEADVQRAIAAAVLPPDALR